MNQEIELYSKMADPLLAAEKMGGFFARSGLFGVDKTETGIVLALACMAERKSPFEIARTYHIVEGKLAMRSDAMLAKFRQAGGKVKWKQFDDKAAIGVWSFDGAETEIGFTMEDAKKMEVIRPRSGWTKAPDAMLRARCIAKAVRMICPEVIAGYLSIEEITDDSDAAPKEIILPASSVTVTPPETTPAPKRGRPSKVAEQPAIDVPSNVVTMPAPATPPLDAPKPEPAKPEPAKPDEPTIAPAPKAEASPTPAPAPAEKLVAKPGPNGVGVSTDTIAGLMAIIGEHEANAIAWLMKKTWIVDNNIATIKPENAQKIFSHTAAFMKEMERMKAAAK